MSEGGGRSSLRFGVLAIVLAVAQTLLIVLRPGGDFVHNLSTNLVVLLGASAGGAGCLWAVRRRAQPRTAWLLLGLACLSWALGQLVWTYYEAVLGVDVPFPSLADVGYLAFIPLAAAGVLYLLPSRSTRTYEGRLFLDGLIIAASLVLLSWLTVLEPVFGTTEPGSILANVISIAYPVSDIVVAAVIFLVVGRAGPSGRIPVVVVGVGLLVFAVSDSAFAVLVATDAYHTGHVIDLGWPGGLLLVGYAALLATERPLRMEENLRPSRAWTVVVPNAPVAVGLLLAVLQVVRDGSLDRFLFWTLMALTALVLGRQVLTQIEDLRLGRKTEISYQRLRELEDERQRLIQNVVHDLNGPLTPLTVQTHLLRVTPSLPLDLHRNLDILDRNIKLIQALVRDLLDFSKIGGRQLKLDIQLADLQELVHRATESHLDVAKAHDIKLVVHAETPLPVRVDSQRITQVVYNLLSNAIKFTPAGGSIHVFAGPHERHARIQVRDTGRGLTEGEAAEIFKPFSQVHAAGESKERGTGLGLYISQGILEAHGGRVWAESQGLGLGATFSFEVALDPRPFDVRQAPRPAGGTPQPPPLIGT